MQRLDVFLKGCTKLKNRKESGKKTVACSLSNTSLENTWQLIKLKSQRLFENEDSSSGWVSQS